MGKITNKAILLAIKRPNESEEIIHEYLNELSFLSQTAGIEGVKQVVQALPRPKRISEAVKNTSGFSDIGVSYRS